jgi:hypothetical protein
MEINAVPNPKLLNILFEFPVPSVFVTVMKAFWEVARESGDTLAILVDELCGFHPEGEECRYQQTPPELFPIGRPGVDGIHYGYVIHAPEHVADDYPIGEICPMDSDGVLCMGRDTRETFEILLSKNITFTKEDDRNARRADLAKQVAAILGYALSPEKAALLSRRDSDEAQALPPILAHERHVRTSDGIGVLADRQLFRPAAGRDQVNYNRMDTVLDRARADLGDGFPATALVHLREGYWLHWTEDGALAKYGDLMRQVYEALGRPRLADLVVRRMRKYS